MGQGATCTSLADWEGCRRERDKLITELQEAIQSAQKSQKAAPDSKSRTLGVRERESMLKLIIGMAKDKYGYNPDVSKSPTTEKSSTPWRGLASISTKIQFESTYGNPATCCPATKPNRQGQNRVRFCRNRVRPPIIPHFLEPLRLNLDGVDSPWTLPHCPARAFSA